MIKLRFEVEKETKNTIRFKEVTEDIMDPGAIGTLYVQKSALKAIGFTIDKSLEVTLEVK